MLKVYCDGACSGNPGPGGWAFVIPELKIEKSGFEPNATNNRMEITAVFESLKFVYDKFPDSCDGIEIITDSQYVVNTMTKGWKKNKNTDLWSLLDYYAWYFRDIKWTWIKGHADNEYNQRCDELAVDEYKSKTAKIIQVDSKKEAVDSEYYDEEIPLDVVSPQLSVAIALTAHKRYGIDGHIYTILDCPTLPDLFVIEKDYSALIFHGTLKQCMTKLRSIRNKWDKLPF